MESSVLWRIIIVILVSLPLSSCSRTATSTELIIYSGRSEAFMQPIVAAFRAQYPSIHVTLKSGKNSELAAAILEEQTNPQADIFISTDQLTHINLSQQGGLAAVDFAGKERIPGIFQDSAGMWYAVTQRTRVIMYNTDLVRPEDAPQSMTDLTDPRWRGRVAIANSNNGPMQAQVASMIALQGTDATRQWLQDLVANETVFFGGAADLRKAVGAGEFAVGVVNHYNYEVQRREATFANVGIVYPDQQPGHFGLLVNTTAIGQVRNAPHPDAAALFLAFVFTDGIQAIFAERNYEYPVIPGVTLADGIPELSQFMVADTDMHTIATLVPQAVTMMQEVGIP